jgi:tetratricopeptide (TPR) repeat protein
MVLRGVPEIPLYRQLLLKQYKEAEASYHKALALLLENKRVSAEAIKKLIAGTYHRLGWVAHEQRHWSQAEAYYHQALQIDIEYNDRYAQADTYHHLGWVAQEQHQWLQAEQYYQHALQIFIEYQDRYEQARTYHELGVVAEEQRKFQQARDYFLLPLETFAAYNDTYSAEIVWRSLARLWQTSGDTSLPATIASALDMPPAEVETLLRQALGNEAEGEQTE